MKRGLAIICLVVAGCAWSVATGLSVQAASVRQPRSICQGSPKYAPRGMVPVYVWLLATSSGKPDRAYGTTVKSYRRMKRHGKLLNAVVGYNRVGSSCWTIALFKRTRVPQWVCVTVRHGAVAPGGPCQPVVRDQYGSRTVSLLVALP
jgi:hypothetical protein